MLLLQIEDIERIWMLMTRETNSHTTGKQVCFVCMQVIVVFFYKFVFCYHAHLQKLIFQALES